MERSKHGRKSVMVQKMQKKMKKRLEETKKDIDFFNEEQKEAFVDEILNTSESYLEKNLNAAANNMSLLTLHSI